MTALTTSGGVRSCSARFSGWIPWLRRGGQRWRVSMSVLGVPWPIAVAGLLSLAIVACSSPERTLGSDSGTPDSPEARADGSAPPIDDCVGPSSPYLVDGAGAEAGCPPADPPSDGLVDAPQAGSEPPSGGPPGVFLLEEIVGVSGGVFLSRDGSVHMLFPPGAVPSDSVVRVTRVDTAASPPPRPPLATRAGETVLYVGLTTLDGRPVPVLLRDVELCVRYTTGDLDAGDGEASRLSLGRFDEGSLRWDVPRNKLDDGEGMVCATTLRLSVWAIFAEVGGGAWPGLGWWWAPVIGGGVVVVGGGIVVGGGVAAWRMRRRKPATPHGQSAPTYETPVIKAPTNPPRLDQQVEVVDQAPAQESATAQSEVTDAADEARVDYAARASTTLQELQRLVMRADANIASVLGPRPPQDIPSLLDSVLNDIRASSLEQRASLLQRVVSTSTRGESVYDREVDRVIRAFPTDATTSLLSAVRAFRISRYVATRALHDPLSLFDAPAIAGDRSGPSGHLRLRGEVSALRGRVCSIDGISVVLPKDPGLLRRLSPGQSVSVDGVLGRQATIFASSVQLDLPWHS